MRFIATFSCVVLFALTALSGIRADDEVVYVERESVPTNVSYEDADCACEPVSVRYETNECDTCEVEGTLPSEWGVVPW
jgi:hypothetical protein